MKNYSVSLARVIIGIRKNESVRIEEDEVIDQAMFDTVKYFDKEEEARKFFATCYADTRVTDSRYDRDCSDVEFSVWELAKAVLDEDGDVEDWESIEIKCDSFEIEVDERTIEEKILDTTNMTESDKIKHLRDGVFVYSTYEEFFDNWIGDDEDAPAAWDSLDTAVVDGTTYRYDLAL